MGFRHLVVVDGNLFVVGMITRSDMNEHHLEHIWHSEVCMYVPIGTSLPDSVQYTYIQYIVCVYVLYV